MSHVYGWGGVVCVCVSHVYGCVSYASVCHMCMGGGALYASVCHMCTGGVSYASVCHMCTGGVSYASVCHMCDVIQADDEDLQCDLIAFFTSRTVLVSSNYREGSSSEITTWLQS